MELTFCYICGEPLDVCWHTPEERKAAECEEAWASHEEPDWEWETLQREEEKRDCERYHRVFREED